MTRIGQLRGLSLWAFIAVGWWLLFGLVAATQYYTLRAMDGVPVSWAHALVPTMTSALLWLPLSVLALWLAERYPLGGTCARRSRRTSS